MVKLKSNQIKFVIKTILDAAHNVKFQERWTVTDTWAKLIDHFYKPPLDRHFDGEDLVYAVGRTKWIVDAIETTNYVDEMLRLFRNNHRQKNCPVIWGFYACSKDGMPKGRT
jgi:hypothetical protein